jgi:hypothetical protein
MTETAQRNREEYERYARACLDLVTHSTDPATRATFTAMALAWLKLAGWIMEEGSRHLGRLNGF